MAKTIDELITKFTDVFYIKDTSVIPFVCATYLSNRKKETDPIWAFIIGGSSSGKSEIISSLSKTHAVTCISMLTPNTLLSGMKTKKGTETSLLLQIPRESVILMKDFTTILSMAKDDQQAIMGQFREMFDGRMDKATGAGERITWIGKINLIAGTTEKIYVMEEKFSSMGTRALYYVLPELERGERILTTKRAAKIAAHLKEYRESLADEVKEYLEGMIDTVKDAKYEVPEEISNNIINICDLASLTRSPIEKDFQKQVDLKLSNEMPMRMSNQIHVLAQTYMAMYNGTIPKRDELTLYKIPFDSMPKGRRMALRVMAQYDESTTKGIAMRLHYSTTRTRLWLEELDALKIIERRKGNGRNGDIWIMKEEYLKIMRDYDHVEFVGGTLDTNEENPFDDASYYDKPEIAPTGIGWEAFE